MKKANTRQEEDGRATYSTEIRELFGFCGDAARLLVVLLIFDELDFVLFGRNFRHGLKLLVPQVNQIWPREEGGKEDDETSEATDQGNNQEKQRKRKTNRS
jgi:hypothetical protein